MSGDLQQRWEDGCGAHRQERVQRNSLRGGCWLIAHAETRPRPGRVLLWRGSACLHGIFSTLPPPPLQRALAAATTRMFSDARDSSRMHSEMHSKGSRQGAQRPIGMHDGPSTPRRPHRMATAQAGILPSQEDSPTLLIYINLGSSLEECSSAALYRGMSLAGSPLRLAQRSCWCCNPGMVRGERWYRCYANELKIINFIINVKYICENHRKCVVIRGILRHNYI